MVFSTGRERLGRTVFVVNLEVEYALEVSAAILVISVGEGSLLPLLWGVRKANGFCSSMVVQTPSLCAFEDPWCGILKTHAFRAGRSRRNGHHD